MKRLKLFFTGAVVLATVGAALAFTPNNVNAIYRCRDTGTGSGNCPTSTTRYTQVDQGTPGSALQWCNNGTDGDGTCNELERVVIPGGD
jgi:hypothetical protein